MRNQKKYEIRKCIVYGIFNPGIIIEGWVSNDFDTVSLLCKGESIWSVSTQNETAKITLFTIRQRIVKCVKLELWATKNGQAVRLTNIYTHIGKRIYNKMVDCLKTYPSENDEVCKDKVICSENKPDCLTYNPENADEYRQWLKNNEDSERIDNMVSHMSYTPLISIVVPVYNISSIYLTECIESVRKQSYQNWEMCLADDASTLEETIETLMLYRNMDSRIKVVFRKENGHISEATNSALGLAKGEFVGFLDNDDVLSVDALEKIVSALNLNRDIDCLYTDEDKIDLDGKRVEPHFKPNFAFDHLLLGNYFCHFLVVRKKILNEIGGLRKGYEGAQDYDLILRIVERTKNIHHIPEILYHWRKTQSSTALGPGGKSYSIEAGRKAIESFLVRNHIDAKANIVPNTFSYSVVYNMTRKPLVDIVIVLEESLQDLSKTIEEWLVKVPYNVYEFVIISEKEHLKRELKEYKDIVNIVIVKNIRHFNQYVEKCNSDLFLFWDTRNVIADPQWIETLLPYAIMPFIGAVGCNILNIATKEFMSGYVIASSSRIIPVRKWYILMGYAPTNRVLVGKTGYIVNKNNLSAVKGLRTDINIENIHLDLQIRLYKKLKRNIVAPQVYFYVRQDLRWGEQVSEEINLSEVFPDPYYNPNFSNQIAYQLPDIGKE